jgi:hypothetical protein
MLKQIVFFVGAVLFLGLSLFIYGVFKGLPWEKQMFKRDVEQYLENKYADRFNLGIVRYIR